MVTVEATSPACSPFLARGSSVSRAANSLASYSFVIAAPMPTAPVAEPKELL